MKNLPLLIGTLVITVALVVGLAFFFSGSNTPKVADAATLVGTTQNIKGHADAKVTVVEFSDLQCPACKATQPLVDQLLQKDGSQIRFIYRHFPLVEIHKNSLLAAQAAESAASFGKFWEFHDTMFANQDEWAELPADQARAKMIDYADKLRIDKTQFAAKIDDSASKQRVTDDMADGTKVGINETPTFYVNGVKTAAPQLVSTVESILAAQK